MGHLTMDSRYEERIKNLISKLTTTVDPIFVESLAREVLEERPAEVLAELIIRLGQKTFDPRARIVYCGILRLVFSGYELPRQVREEVYSLCVIKGKGPLARFLLPLPPSRSALQQDMPRDPYIEDMPLGMRKWKARLHNRDLLHRLMKDTNPVVAQIVLDNPKLTEADVVSWAAARPNVADVLLKIISHRKWSLRQKVQEAVARNPYTPVHVAAALMPLLPTKVLRQILMDRTLAPLAREAAGEVLRLRTETKSV